MFHASYDHRDLLSRCESARVSICCATLLLLVAAFPASARSGEEIETEILDAYSTGLNRKQNGNLQRELSIRRFGNTRLLIGMDPSGKPVTELVCLLCTDDELISEARSVAAQTAASARGIRAAVVEVDERDGRERIYIDGIPLAPMGGKHPIEAGEHEITEVQKNGIRHSMMTLDPGGRVVLSDVSREPRDPSRMNKVRVAAATCGVGLATATLGGLFLWLDRKCATSDCSLKHYLEGPGIGLLVAGVLVQGVVVWLLVSSRRHRKGASQ